jgi:imidazolonepropionase-like amidohydrolase
MSARPAHILINNARIFDGKADGLSGPMNVLVVGNQIEAISPEPIVAAEVTTRIEAGARTLMPGLIDAHTHLMFSSLPAHVMLVSDVGFLNVVATSAASDTLLRGFTSVRAGVEAAENWGTDRRQPTHEPRARRRRAEAARDDHERRTDL